MHQQIEDLCALAQRHAPVSPGAPIPRFTIKTDIAPTRPAPALYQPMACFVLQGAKRITVGGRTMEYRGSSVLVASVDLPVTGEVVLASSDRPYLAMALALDPAAISGLLLDMPPDRPADGASALTVSSMTPDLADPLLRMARLLDAPGDIPVLAPMLEREILYRLLLGPQGGLLRQIACPDGRLAQIRRAIAWIRENYAQPLRVAELAALAGMSDSAFHRHFKAVTDMSPLQYHKQIRLQEARRRLLAQPGAVARVAFDVGYESASQFSREYARQFGLPPARDVARLHETALQA